MLLKALVRPVANNVCKIPSRSTSAVVGARSRHVSNGVSINFKLSFLRINCSLRGKKQSIFKKCKDFILKYFKVFDQMKESNG